MGYWNGDMSVWVVLGMVLMLLFWAGVIGLVAWGTVRLTKHSDEDNSGFGGQVTIGLDTAEESVYADVSALSDSSNIG